MMHLKNQFSHAGVMPAPHQSSYRWVILLLIWFLYVCHGIVSRSAAPLVTPMMEDLHISYGQMGIVLGSWQLTYLLVAIFVGLLVDRWGLRKSLFCAGILIGMSSALRYFAQGFYSLLMMVALFGVGGSLISIGVPKAVSQWFVGKDRGTAVGIYTSGPWIGQLSVLAVTNSVVMPLTGNSWRLTFFYYGLFCFGAAMFWWILGRETVSETSSRDPKFLSVIARLFKIRNVLIILAAGLLCFSISHGFIGWLPNLLEHKGISPSSAGLYSSFPFLFSIPSVLIIPRVVQKHLRGWSIAVLLLINISAIILISSSTLPLLLGLFLYGISSPPLTPLLILMLMDTPQVGSRYMGSAGGLFFCVVEIGGFFGPFMMGYLVDLTGSFLAGATFLALLGIIAFTLMFLLKFER